jgi:hypothetical protein
MPTVPFLMASTQKETYEQLFLHHHLSCTNPNAWAALTYYGQTTNATPTELFINGKLGVGTANANKHRLFIPESSALMFEAYAMAYNRTDDIFPVAAKYVGGVSNVNGSVNALKDYDGVAGGTQAFIIDTIQNVLVGGTLVSFVADDTNDALTVTVTGVAAKVIDWYVTLVATAYIAETSDRFFGDAGLGLGQ